jgi:hypothetical protein
MPNIASKGKLLPRAVHLPASTMPRAATIPIPPVPSTPDIGIGKSTLDTNSKTPLIQEISTTHGIDRTTSTEPKLKGKSSDSLPGLRGIMKNSSSVISKPLQTINPNTPLDWSWMKEDSGRLRVEVSVPGLVSFCPFVPHPQTETQYRLLIRRVHSPNPLPLTSNRVILYSPSPLDEPLTSI